MSAPQPTRQLTYYVATSLDNFIATENGTVEGFLQEGQFISDYVQSLQSYDTVLMGKNTYEFGYQYGIKPGEPAPIYGHMMQYVLSKSMHPYQSDKLQVIQDDAAEFVAELKSQDGGNIYLSGGGTLAGFLLNHQLIDDLIVKINPFIMGSGIPLFKDAKDSLKLRMLSSKVYQEGVLFVHYAICY